MGLSWFLSRCHIGWHDVWHLSGETAAALVLQFRPARWRGTASIGGGDEVCSADHSLQDSSVLCFIDGRLFEALKQHGSDDGTDVVPAASREHISHVEQPAYTSVAR